MSIEDKELLAEFVVESQEHLENVESHLLTLEAQPDSIDIALVNNVFRAVHSIKGAAGFLGLQTLESLAHREEEVLNRLRNQEMRPTSIVVSTLLAATDRLKGLINAIETSNEEDVSAHIAALESLLNERAVTVSVPPVKDTGKSQTGGAENHEGDRSSPAMSTTAAAETCKDQGSETGREPNKEFVIESYDNLEQIERDLVSIERDPSSSDLVHAIFRNLHTIKGSSGFFGYANVEKLAHSAENLLGKLRTGNLEMSGAISDLMFSTVDTLRRYLQKIDREGTDGANIAEELIDAINSASGLDLSSLDSKDEPSNDNNASASDSPATKNCLDTDASSSQRQTNPSEICIQQESKAPSSSPAINETPVASAAESTIRVDVSMLDKLMTCVGELVLARNQIIQFTGVLGDSDLLSASQRLNLITAELQEGVMKTRMQPIGNVWSKFPRIVRDLANTCGKEVRIEMEGKETELDKTIIEAIKDPLTHLVRNSVDHGIESPQTRVQSGKNPEGCLLLRAYHEGGQVNIEISDDGAGLNPKRIKAKALEKGLISKDQAENMPDHDAAQLIFLPGFSTAEKISNVSGRGVGMDVVKTNIEKIGGAVDVKSQVGLGTVIKIKIPLTLAIIPALVITNDNSRFAIPQVNLLELVRLESDNAADSIEWIQGSPVYRLRGKLLPLVFMNTVLQSNSLRSEQSNRAINIVVLRADERQFGLVVDQINDTEEIVVKPLTKQLKSIPVFSGATIMGDGQVALILDVMGLAFTSNVISKERDRKLVDSATLSQSSEGTPQTLLILETVRNHRLALPISQVARLEKIEKTKIEFADNQEVVQYRNEILPLIRLARVLGMETHEECESPCLNVIVYNEGTASVGFVVHRIVDIVETHLEVSRQSTRTGLLATSVIKERVTNVVDLPAVIRQSGVLSQYE
ncbi:chemotaxis protein CheW [Pirellulaceae bacterium SH449]